MATQVASEDAKQVARPLRVLVPLIKEDLKNAEDAAASAAQPYYQAAAEKLAEARAQMTYSEYLSWAWRHFKIKNRQADKYLSIAKDTAINRSARYSSMSEHLRDIGHPPRGSDRGGATWQTTSAPLRDVLNKVDTDTLNLRRAEMNRVEEREAQRKLALQLIDIGYKALASKLHPDTGGSSAAMKRLNEVRTRLKAHA